MPTQTKKPAITPEQQLEKIQKRLGHVKFEWVEEAWLDTGVPQLNQVLGDPVLGPTYGQITEIVGLESVGKTAATMTIVALAQKDGAEAIWIDFENSWKPKWAEMRGVDLSRITIIKPYIGVFEKNKPPRMAYAEELCTQAEALMPILAKRAGKVVCVIDSLVAMQPKIKAETNMENQSAYDEQALPKLLNKLLGRWVGLVQVNNVLLLATNQLRQNPRPKPFTDPWYVPGGNAMKFYGHVRVKMKRTGKIVDKNKKQVGIQGIIHNFKHKNGGLEHSEIGYRLMFDGTTKFVPARDVAYKRK